MIIAEKTRPVYHRYGKLYLPSPLLTKEGKDKPEIVNAPPHAYADDGRLLTLHGIQRLRLPYFLS